MEHSVHAEYRKFFSINELCNAIHLSALVVKVLLRLKFLEN
jgi:hypothetical protein